MPSTETLEINDINDLREATDRAADIEAVKHNENPSDEKVLLMIDDGDHWLEDRFKSPLITYEDGEPVSGSAVSERAKYYTPIQHDEPLRPLVNAIESNDAVSSISGMMEIGSSRQRITTHLTFNDNGTTFTGPTQSDISTGLKLETAHTGFSAVRVDVGAVRLVCSNGMVAWDSDMEFKHEHNDGRFNPDLVNQAVDAIVNGTEQVEARFKKAHDEPLGSKEQMFMLLLDCGIDYLFEDPYETLQEAFETERGFHDNPRQFEVNPSLWDAYCVGCHAVEHLVDESDWTHPERAKNSARTRLTELVEYYDGSVPNGEQLVYQTVETWQDERMANDDLEEHEESLLRTVAAEV